ncbi:hypothetical protein WJX72_006440 [[Myrmecia] bisecta]|uniref:glutaredoxin-dependent peroxiredoxin n=1 Tax=[Myrmecia] bisecta TaxID=41462 RepID=A0AAW1R703_9CHLO
MLRSDIFLSTVDGKYSLKEVFKGKRAVFFGVPDMGKVCSEKHAPAYLALADKMHDMGVERIYCIAVSDPETVKAWADKKGLTGTKVQVLADKSGAFARMLGLDVNEPDCDGPRSLRYMGVVDNGILLKLKVETNIGEVKVTSADCVLELLQKMKELNTWN